MKYCTKCGAQISDNDLFCPKCGHKVGAPVEDKGEYVDDKFYSTTLIRYFDGANNLEIKKYTIEQLLSDINKEIQKAEYTYTDYQLRINKNKTRIQQLEDKMANYKEAEYAKQTASVRSYKKPSFIGYYDFEDFGKAILVTAALFLAWVLGSLAFAQTGLNAFFNFLNKAGTIGVIATLGSIFFIIPIILLFALYSFQQAIVESKLNTANTKRQNEVDKLNAKKEAEHKEKQAKIKADFFENSKQEIAKLTSENKQLDVELAFLEKILFPELDSAKAKTQSALEAQQNVLSQYYSVNIIYPKYRDLVPVSTMLEYLNSGRVNRLTSVEGAYHVYETELKQELIINKLDDLIDSNQAILKSQYSLIQAVNSVRSEVGRLTNNMHQIADESLRNKEQIVNGIKKLTKTNELANYYARVTNENIAELKYLEEERNNYYKYSTWY